MTASRFAYLVWIVFGAGVCAVTVVPLVYIFNVEFRWNHVPVILALILVSVILSETKESFMDAPEN